MKEEYNWEMIMQGMMKECNDNWTSGSHKKIQVGDKMITVTLQIRPLESPDLIIPESNQRLLKEDSDDN